MAKAFIEIPIDETETLFDTINNLKTCKCNYTVCFDCQDENGRKLNMVVIHDHKKFIEHQVYFNGFEEF